MKVLVTGANGQLGKELVFVLGQRGYDVIGYGRKQLDITNLTQVRDVISGTGPNAILHAAAYTAVDAAESDVDNAYRVNAFGTRNVAIAAEEVGAKLCYISTDYVFDGTALAPYTEYDNTNPVGVYGKSKRAGELFVQSLSSKYYIVRTSWVYGANGNNFVKTMLKLGSEKKQLKVVGDQVGSPTFTVDLALFLAELLSTDFYGIYHASNTGSCSWYEFAKSIFALANLSVQLEPCMTKDFPRPAPRPAYSVMDHMAIRANGFTDLRHWQYALLDFIKRVYA